MILSENSKTIALQALRRSFESVGKFVHRSQLFCSHVDAVDATKGYFAIKIETIKRRCTRVV